MPTPGDGGWAPVEEIVPDDMAVVPLRHLAALLDYDAPPWMPDILPPLAHWLFFLPRTQQSLLGEDGHPKRGGFLPPIAAPRRMWAGSHVGFLTNINIGEIAIRRSFVTSVESKEGRSGGLTFVTVRHEIRQRGILALIEEQDIVYRDAVGNADAAVSLVERRPDGERRSVVADERLLFRFSALTFNAHRIHYDLRYAREVEGYDGLVVHGPLQAMLLVDHLLRCRPDFPLASFRFRGSRPLLATGSVNLHLEDQEGGTALWTTDAAGDVCLTAFAARR